MRGDIVRQILKKEVIDILRDKKTLFMMVILPILLYPIMILGISQIMTLAANSMEQKTLSIAIQGPISHELRTELGEIKDGQGKLEIIQVQDCEASLATGEIDAYIEMEKQEGQEVYTIYMNASETDSSSAGARIEDQLDQYKEKLVVERVKTLGLDEKILLHPIVYNQLNVAKDEEMAGSLLGQLLPFILVIGVMMGCIYPAIDVMAGEKERGTLETLLTLPISNLELIMGKYLAVSLSAVVTAMFNIGSILVTVAFMLGSSGLVKEGFTISWAKMSIPLIIAMISVCLFAMVIAAISMCVCSLAKNFKEAQNYITPLMLMVMLPSYISMVPTITLTPFTASIPVVNISLLIKSVLGFKYDFSLMSIVLISNLAFVIIAVTLLSKMFNSEEILFGDSKSFNLLERRSNIQKGSLPGISDGLMIYVIALLATIYLGTLAQVKWGLVGVAITQILIIVTVGGAIYYLKGNVRQILKINIPQIKDVVGGIVLWMGMFILITLLNQVILHLFPQNTEVAEELGKTLFSEKSFLINLLIVAVMPAICEEFLFRGFLLTAFEQKGKVIRAILLSSILFGFMHIDLIRILPTALLGMTFAYVVYKSQSLVVAMLLHFLNNGLAVWMVHNQYGRVAGILNKIAINLDTGKGLYWIGIGVVFIIIGMIILKISRKNNKTKV